MHLPIFPEPYGRKGAYPEAFAQPDLYIISVADARLVFSRGVAVATTCATCSAENFEKPNTFETLNDREERFVQITLRNLRQLKDEGVLLIVGSDAAPGAGTLKEMEFLEGTGIFSNLELLRMWSEATPRAIFPRREIGRLEEDYEASFLVLDADPIQDFNALKKIRMQSKQGTLIQGGRAAD